MPYSIRSDPLESCLIQSCHRIFRRYCGASSIVQKHFRVFTARFVRGSRKIRDFPSKVDYFGLAHLVSQLIVAVIILLLLAYESLKWMLQTTYVLTAVVSYMYRKSPLVRCARFSANTPGRPTPAKKLRAVRSNNTLDAVQRAASIVN